VAAAKGVYTALHQMVLGEELEYATDSFDTAVATGVFTAAHAPASSFPELVRITKPGGHIIFTLSDQVYEGSGFKEMLDGLQAQGQWKLVEASESRKLTNDSPFTHRIWTFEVTA
jgi:SAM-dependent methyltransferase